MTPTKTLVLDDDPTGTQCTSGLDLILIPSDGELRRFVDSDATAAHVLTNARSRSASETTEIVREAVARTNWESGRVRYVLRGDSTLRGHVEAELGALDLHRKVAIVVPAFPALGRVTIGGVHYVRVSDRMLNAADTEFAQDPVFGFRARTMREWVKEVVPGREAVEISLAQVRSGDGSEVAELLRDADAGTILVPDIETDDDLRSLTRSVLSADAACDRIIVRCAAPMAAMLTGYPGRSVTPTPGPGCRTLVVCGSHTRASTAQVDALVKSRAVPVVLNSSRLLEGSLVEESRQASMTVRRLIRQGRVPLLCTERERSRYHGTLEHGAAIMRGLVEVVRLVRDVVDVLITKGGITSADVTSLGMGVARARVLGQLEPGVSLWDVPVEGRTVRVAVVPGNVGDEHTLVRTVERFMKVAEADA